MFWLLNLNIELNTYLQWCSEKRLIFSVRLLNSCDDIDIKLGQN